MTNILGDIETALASACETGIDAMRMMGFATHDLAELQRLCEVVDVAPREVFDEMARVYAALKSLCTIFGAKVWTNDGRIYVSMSAGCWVYTFDEDGVYFAAYQ